MINLNYFARVGIANEIDRARLLSVRILIAVERGKIQIFTINNGFMAAARNKA